jgi:antitoxin VapB
MGLNIKSATAEKAIRDLAAATGETLTEAVERAALERLARIQSDVRPRTGQELLARLLPLLDRIETERLAKNDRRSSKELQDELYDEHGLPK